MKPRENSSMKPGPCMTRDFQNCVTFLDTCRPQQPHCLSPRSDDDAATTSVPGISEASQNRARRQCLYGFGLTMSILLNTILRAYDPKDANLVDEPNHLAHEIIALAEQQASIYRPLGAAYMLLCLMSAWTASADTDASIHAEVDPVLADYQLDFLGPRAKEGCVKLMLVI